MNANLQRFLLFLVFSLLLHGLLMLAPARQPSAPASDRSSGKALRIEVMTVPAQAVESAQSVPIPPVVSEAPPLARQVPASAPPPAAPIQATPRKPTAGKTRSDVAVAPARVEAPPAASDELTPLTRPVVPETQGSSPGDARDSTAEPVLLAQENPALTVASLPSPASPLVEDPRISALRRAYLDALPPLIRPYQRYPLPALRAGREGTVIVRFVLERDGRLRETAILQSSGDALLDQAAASAIARVPRFPAFPAELPDASLPIELPVRFDRSLR
ncbi:energy transducer TonB [Geoalkalibacter sp.]|uniref:energy transducer TonB n=1 Tax=Geoalkalibacter sp. TaxID=3041440 RepID=UPI00272ED185|nr:energy transducer TonB [Geoalkalibacter sp.]